MAGTLVTGDEVRVRLEGSADGRGIQTAQASVGRVYGLWLLKGAGKGAYEAVPREPGNGDLRWAVEKLPEEAPPGAAAESPPRAVTNELVAVLRWVGKAHATDLEAQVFTERASLFGALKDDLRTLSPEERLVASRILADDSAPALRAVGITGLLYANEPEGLKRFAAEWPRLEVTADSLNMVSALGKYVNPRDGAAIRDLGRLASQHSTFYLFDQTVAFVLRNVHTREALPGLAALLDSQMPVARSFAVTGMCLFVRNAATSAPVNPSLTPDYWGVNAAMRPPTPFMSVDTERYCWTKDAPQDPRELDPYLSFWKGWWRDHEAAFLR